MASPICIFDMDDTLVDSWERLRECSLFILDEAGIPYDEAEMIARIIPLGCRGSAELYYSMGAGHSVEENLAKKEARMEAFYRTRVRPKAGVLALLERLKKMGVRMFVLSATPKRLVELCLQSNGMTDYFEKIWTVDDFGATKAEPALFVRAAARLGVAPHKIHYFEDNMTALKNAKQAGFVTYAVENHHTSEEIREMRAQHDAWIENFENFTFDQSVKGDTACS